MNMRDRVERAYGGKPSADREIEEREPKPARAAPSRAAASPTGPKTVLKAPSLDKAEEKAERLLKTGAETGVSKAAKFLLLLGNEEASKVLAHLSPKEIESVSREIIKVKAIDSIEAADILTEFGWLVKTKGFALEGGAETAEKMLTAAFGAEKARALLMKASPETLRPFRFLDDFEPQALSVILKPESPQVLAVILPYLDPKRASGLIELLPEEQRIEVVKRIARLDKVSPEVLRRIEEGLRDRIRKIGTSTTSEAVDGKAALAGILRHVDPKIEAEVLGALDDESPELSADVRERLFTLEDVLRVSEKDLQKALRDFQDKDLALLLKGRGEDFKAKILGAVSSNRKALILDEYQYLGAVRREDAAEATREFLDYLKSAWQEGELRLDGDDELVY
jgi:flagellar motor switch protein FliG